MVKRMVITRKKSSKMDFDLQIDTLISGRVFNFEMRCLEVVCN